MATTILPNFPAIFGEVEAGRSAKVRQQIENLLKNMHKSTLDVAELLSEVRKNKYYVQWGFDSFSAYAAELDIKSSKAQYLARIADVMEQVGAVRSEYEDVGLSKLREITSLEPTAEYAINDQGNTMPGSECITHLLTGANDLSYAEVKDAVKKLKGLTGDDELVWINFCMKKAARDEVVQPALELVRKQLGSKGEDEDGKAVEYSDGACLECICVEFINDPHNQYYTDELESS